MGNIPDFDDGGEWNIAIHRQLLSDLEVQWPFSPAKQYLGLQPDFAELRDALLGRLGFELTRRLDVGDQRDMHDHHVFSAGL